MNNKFLITGATGFVGSCLTRELIKKGENVSIIVRDKKLNWRLEDIAHKLNIYECDLQDMTLNKKIDKIKPSVVFHLAAAGALPTNQENINQLIDTNIKGTLNLINSIKKHNIKLFVNTGSSSEYGIKEKPISENDSLEPINDYGVTKAAATLFCQKIAKTENLPIITFRLFSPYGYYDDKNRLIPYIIARALKNKNISLSSKENVRDFIFIEDVVQSYLQALYMKIIPGEIINIGSGQQHSVYDILKTIIEITKSNSLINWGNMPKQSRQIEPKIWQANNTKAKKLLDWEQKNNLSQGLQKTVNWFKKNIQYYE